MSKAPAKELEGMWDIFFEIHQKSKMPHRIVRDLLKEPKFTKLTVISIEKKGIERIFEFNSFNFLQLLFLIHSFSF